MGTPDSQRLLDQVPTRVTVLKCQALIKQWVPEPSRCRPMVSVQVSVPGSTVMPGYLIHILRQHLPTPS